MSVQSEAADQVVKIMLDGTEHAIRIAGAGAKELALLIVSLLKDEQRTKGPMRLSSMIRSGKELRVFPLDRKYQEKFCKAAKRYGVLYTVLREKNNKDGIVDVMARAEDASKINRIFERCGIPMVDRTEARNEIVQAKAAAATGKPVQERTTAERSREDVFLDALFSKEPNREQIHTANPLPAAANPSEHSSKKTASRNADQERSLAGESRPSVRKMLESYRRAEEKASRRKNKSERINYPEHKAPPIKRKEYEK